MTPALNASKRKFYKLLDSLSGSQASVSGTKRRTDDSRPGSSLGTEPPSKRTRLSTESDRDPPSNLSRPGSAPTAITAASPAKSLRELARERAEKRNAAREAERNAARPTLEAAAETLPNYAPWSQIQFLSRLKTFADIKLWLPKPDKVNEVQWARRGWVCDGRNTVACKGGCAAKVIVELSGPQREEGSSKPELNEDEILEQLTDKYVELIVSGHDEHCLWRKSGCREDIYRMPISDSIRFRAELRERYSSFTVIDSEQLPMNFNSTFQRKVAGQEKEEDIELETIAQNVEPLIRNPPGEGNPRLHQSSVAGVATLDDKPFNRSAAILAFFGWSGTLLQRIPMATCSLCFARIGLWLYSAKSSSDGGSSTEEPLSFDPTMHRDYCPWINATSQCALGKFKGLSGWDIGAEFLVSDAQRRKRTENRGQDTPGDAASEAQITDDEGAEPGPTREEIEHQDRVRDSRLRRLKAAFSVRRPKSSKGATDT